MIICAHIYLNIITYYIYIYITIHICVYIYSKAVWPNGWNILYNMDVSLVYYPIVKKRKCSWWSAIQRKTIYCCGPGHFILAKPLRFDGKIVTVGSYGCSGSKKTYHTEANPTIVMTPAAKVGLFVFAHGDLTIPLKFRIFQCSLGVLSTRRSAIYVFDNQRTCHTSGLLDPS